MKSHIKNAHICYVTKQAHMDKSLLDFYCSSPLQLLQKGSHSVLL